MGRVHLGAWGCPRHMHMHEMLNKHVRKLQMAATMEAEMFNMHACAYMHVCACMCTYVWQCPHPTSPPSTHSQGDTLEISKNAIRLEQIKIFQFSLKI